MGFGLDVDFLKVGVVVRKEIGSEWVAWIKSLAHLAAHSHGSIASRSLKITSFETERRVSIGLTVASHHLSIVLHYCPVCPAFRVVVGLRYYQLTGDSPKVPVDVTSHCMQGCRTLLLRRLSG